MWITLLILMKTKEEIIKNNTEFLQDIENTIGSIYLNMQHQIYEEFSNYPYEPRYRLLKDELQCQLRIIDHILEGIQLYKALQKEKGSIKIFKVEKIEKELKTYIRFLYRDIYIITVELTKLLSENHSITINQLLQKTIEELKEVNTKLKNYLDETKL